MSSVAPEPRPARELVLTVVLLVLAVGLAGIAALIALFLPLVGDSCGASTTCRSEGLTAGTAVALLGPSSVPGFAL